MKTDWVGYLLFTVIGFCLCGAFLQVADQITNTRPALVRVRVIGIPPGGDTLVEADDGQRVLIDGAPWGIGDALIGQEFITRRGQLPNDYRPFTEEELHELAERERLIESQKPVVEIELDAEEQQTDVIHPTLVSLPAEAEPAPDESTSEWLEQRYNMFMALPLAEADHYALRLFYAAWKDGRHSDDHLVRNKIKEIEWMQGDWAIQGCWELVMSWPANDKMRESLIDAHDEWKTSRGGYDHSAKRRLTELLQGILETAR